jgi:hypothetical protein
MNDQSRDRAPDFQPASGADPRNGLDLDTDDVEGHSATIYRRRRGPYPLRHGAPLPDAGDRTRGERQPPAHRAVA